MFRCKYCNRKFDSEQALASHLRVHKKRKAKAKSEREDDPPKPQPQNENIQPQPQLLAQPQQYQQPQPVPQYVPPQQQYYYQQVQPQQQLAEQPQRKKYDPFEVILGFLSTPTAQAIVEALQNRKSNSGGGEDLIKEIAFKQMIEAWMNEHQFAREHAKNLDEIMKEFMLQFAKRITRTKKNLVVQPPTEERDIEIMKILLNTLSQLNEKLKKIEEVDGEFDFSKTQPINGEFINVGEGEFL